MLFCPWSGERWGGGGRGSRLRVSGATGRALPDNTGWFGANLSCGEGVRTGDKGGGGGGGVGKMSFCLSDVEL